MNLKTDFLFKYELQFKGKKQGYSTKNTILLFNWKEKLRKKIPGAQQIGWFELV